MWEGNILFNNWWLSHSHRKIETEVENIAIKILPNIP